MLLTDRQRQEATWQKKNTDDMTGDEVLTELDNAGLGHYREQAIPLLQPALTLQTLPTPDAEIPVGVSKMGGVPDLPADTPWPCVEEEARPLHFLAQINFAEAATLWPDSPLPKSGLLSVFYDAQETPDRGREGFDVLYTSDVETAGRRELPEPLQTLMKRMRIPGQFNSCALQFTKTVPRRPLAQLETTHEDFDKVFPLSRAGSDDYGFHQMLGRADYEQDEPLSFLAMTALGVDFADGMNAPEGTPLRAQIDAEKHCWLLLLQIDTDDNPNWGWGDGGMLHFHIHERDLAARHFGNVQMEAQCG